MSTNKPTQSRAAKIYARILMNFTRTKYPQTIAQVCTKLGYTDHLVKHAISTMRECGLVRNCGYYLNPKYRKTAKCFEANLVLDDSSSLDSDVTLDGLIKEYVVELKEHAHKSCAELCELLIHILRNNRTFTIESLSRSMDHIEMGERELNRRKKSRLLNLAALRRAGLIKLTTRSGAWREYVCCVQCDFLQDTPNEMHSYSKINKHPLY